MLAENCAVSDIQIYDQVHEYYLFRLNIMKLNLNKFDIKCDSYASYTFNFTKKTIILNFFF